MKPLAIDLFCGLGGWAEGFIAEGYEVVGFDIERHEYGTGGYPGQLVLQDVLTLHGSQFRNAAVIVASPPCQEFSYMAMPWSRAKQIARALRGEDEFPNRYTGSRTVEDLTALFRACFRIAEEAGVPLVVENVRGAEPWVGGARWHFGSFYLWGDVPALLPPVSQRRLKAQVDCSPKMWSDRDGDFRTGTKVPGFRFDGTGKSFQTASVQGVKRPGMNWSDRDNPDRMFNDARKGCVTGLGMGHDWRQDPSGRFNSKSDSRKAASAQIAKIPFPLAQHIACVFKPTEARAG